MFDERKKRSDLRQEALQYLIESVLDRSDVSCAAIVDARSRLVAGAGDASGLRGLALRERGHFERWSQLVDPRHKDAIVYTPAGVWMPVAISEAHYDACDRLGLSADEILAMGNAVARMTQKTVLALTLRLAHEAG